MKLFFSFEDDVYPQLIWANDDRTQLITEYKKDDSYYLAIIDIETMSLLQTIKISFNEPCMVDARGSMAVFYTDRFKRVAVYAENDEGKWEQCFDMRDENGIDFFNDTSHGTWFQDSDRLVFAITSGNGFNIAVFGEKSIEYVANYESSLDCISKDDEGNNKIYCVYDKPIIKLK